MDTEQLIRIAKALADPRRFEMLETIAADEDETPCRRIVEEAQVSQATVSHHLRELANAGLIETRREGQCVYPRIRPAVVAGYLDEVARRLGAAAPSAGGRGRR